MLVIIIFPFHSHFTPHPFIRSSFYSFYSALRYGETFRETIKGKLRLIEGEAEKPARSTET